MSAIRANFQDTLAPELATVYFDRYEAEPEVRPQVFKEETSGRDKETDSAVSGFSLLIQTSELGPLDYEDPNQMFKTVYSHLKYTKGFKVSEELVEDDQHNVIRAMPAALGKATKRTQEYYAAAVLNNAFTPTSTSYGDGKPLCSTSHTRADGGTAQSNANSTGLTLTEDNLETVRIAARKILDDKGQKIVLRFDKMIIPVDLEKTANILTQSQLRSGTANNDVNVYKGVFSVIPWEYLTSTTAWFLQDARNHLMKWYWRIRPEFKQDTGFDSGAQLYKTRIRFSTGWSDYRGIYGSKGNGSEYSS